jgi:hypothetical protein
MVTDCDCFGLKMDESQWRERERDIVRDMVLERERERDGLLWGERERGRLLTLVRGEGRVVMGRGREREREREREEKKWFTGINFK